MFSINFKLKSCDNEFSSTSNLQACACYRGGETYKRLTILAFQLGVTFSPSILYWRVVKMNPNSFGSDYNLQVAGSVKRQFGPFNIGATSLH